MAVEKKRRKKDLGYRHGTPLGEYTVVWSYLFIPTHIKTIKPLLVFLKTVIFDFFYLQWAVKLGLRNIPVICVDHPLDSKIPFRPGFARVYLDFTNFWIRPFSLLYTYLGISRALPYCAEYLRLIAKLYQQASRMYKCRMSTTTRTPSKNSVINSIRKVDPHYLCVPSLHIAVVALTCAFYKNVFKKEKNLVPKHIIDPANLALFFGAVEIAETVLYIKQHSVNCIPAALYMLHNIAPELFSIGDAVEFIDSLFVEAQDVSVFDKRLITVHIQHMFERLLLEGFYEPDWVTPVKRWIESYHAAPPED